MGCSSCNKNKIKKQPRMPGKSSPSTPSPQRTGGGMRSKNRRAMILNNRKNGQLPTRPRKRLR